ncbi:MAG: hypothetical protein BGN85_08700 [Alphaproteobacteria bacterium 64-11]|nr:MAG: hypothetical protein BGN85_08700 [Alphaproteobacteria bacterium 64-11]
MPEIDRERFAEDVERELAERFSSFNAAVRACPELNKALLSRAVNANPLSAASMLALCQRLGLDPFAYLSSAKRRRRSLADIRKDMEKQTVTEVATRETGSSGQGVGA